MSRNFFYIIAFFIVLFLIWSCSPYRYIDIQVLKPAEVAWSHKIDTLYVLETIKLNDNDTSTHNRMLYVNFLLSFNKTLTKQLKESPFFVSSNIRSVPYHYLLDKYPNINFEERKDIYVCTIEAFETKDSIYKTKVYDEIGIFTLVTYRIIYKAKLRFTNYINLAKEISLEDTVWWDSRTIYDTPNNVSVTANKPEAYTVLGELAAANMAKKIAPYWVTEERVIFYTSNKLMRKGYYSFAENNAPDAIKYWEKLYDSGTKRLAAMASYNIALSYETIDSLKLSKYWLGNSIKLKNDSATSRYLKHISTRISEKEKLDEQFKMKNKQIN